ncbi:hypothetical protein CH333_07365 [candidate division WOR-3 bacterium JGI_Cruoil_03_44_89]|uniref:Uncharacterized protein n=1 Tax=candidate division WOR-3 bacterium JGI_Cruoil_03_44_89 TaxID=1973748 RepID=A0A235BR77_UNCW3|nr:MAG: hypothetical protein CH333_07365 [candidate division WOR-3 bacterium JGI_Cruoil_03_44_89]
MKKYRRNHRGHRGNIKHQKSNLPAVGRYQNDISKFKNALGSLCALWFKRWDKEIGFTYLPTGKIRGHSPRLWRGREGRNKDLS